MLLLATASSRGVHLENIFREKAGCAFNKTQIRKAPSPYGKNKGGGIVMGETFVFNNQIKTYPSDLFSESIIFGQVKIDLFPGNE
jgi:hypothetical protein